MRPVKQGRDSTHLDASGPVAIIAVPAEARWRSRGDRLGSDGALVGFASGRGRGLVKSKLLVSEVS